MLHPVILCGGSGTRLWPLSRQALPKQFHRFASQHTLLQDTVLRGSCLPDTAPPIIVSNQEHRFLVADQLLEIGVAPAALVLEPVGRNTAPAVALGALAALESDPEALLLVMPSDHVITDLNAFGRAVDKGRVLAEAGFLVTFGIVPDKPETGYGYIERGEGIKDAEGAFTVARFVEKPDQQTAQKFLDSGRFSWNSGLFLLRARDFLSELERHAPTVLSAVRAAWQTARTDLDFCRVEETAFAASPSISVDYAVMEHTDRAAVIPADIGWNDVGSYAALWDVSPKDEGNNVARGEVALFGARDCYASSEKQLVALLGVEDLIVVVTPDAILVTRKGCAQDVKQIVERLRAEGRTEHEMHRQVFRPWGTYEGIDRGDRFQVKQLVVKPGAKTSMQVHHHRSEHWIIVRGTAQVTRGEENLLLSENESIYIPLGVPHRIHNPGRIPLHIVEVQSGSYLEEDDIVRLDDQYGREE